MSWPRDDAKLDRVRALMGERGLDALVVRAPDNVLYLTNFWSMKGYDVCVFPREGDPVLLCLEASEADAERMAWTSESGSSRATTLEIRARPLARALDAAKQCASEYGTVGLELSLGTQAADRMVGEPTTFTADWFRRLRRRRRCDAAPRRGARDQDRAGDRAHAARERHRRRRRWSTASSSIEPGMTEAQIAAEWEGFVHGEGTGWEGKVELALGFSLVWSGPGIQTFTATTSRPVVEGEPTLFEIWVCADGYWCDHTKNLVVGDLTPAYRELEQGLMAVYDDAIDFARPGASLAELDRRIRAGIAALGFPGQPSHPICHGVGARAHEPPYAHQAGGGEIREGMVLAIEPGCYIEGGGGLRVEDNFLITTSGAEKLSPFPDGIVQA